MENHTFNVYSVIAKKGENSWDPTTYTRGDLQGQVTAPEHGILGDSLRAAGYKLPALTLDRRIDNDANKIGIHKPAGFMNTQMLLWCEKV
jgi:hypothetical protein